MTDERRIDGNKLGFGVSERYPLHAATVASAGKYAWDQNIQILRLTGKALGQVFSGQRSVRNTVSGPIGIFQATQKSIEKLGWDGAFGMLGFLSLNLGIFNLLPIPVLDGGAIFLLLIEGLLALVGLSISTTVRERIQQVGFVVVLLLMVFVISNDFVKMISRNREEKPPATETAK
jgi:regulator of sigma E protease